MGLKFKCVYCDKIIIGKFLILSDEVDCPHCGRSVQVPDKAEVTTEKSNTKYSKNVKGIIEHKQ